MTSTLFEWFNPLGVILKNAQILALYGHGKSTGLVLDIGKTHTVCVPMFEGQIITHAVVSSNLSGDAVNQSLVKILKQSQGLSFETNVEKEIIEDIKKKFCFVTLDEEFIVSRVNTGYFVEGIPLYLAQERTLCTEILFQQNVRKKEEMGLHVMVNQSITKSDVSVQQLLWNNICIIGGTSLLPGLEKRLLKELKFLAPNVKKMQILETDDKINAVWKGAALFANSSNAQTVLKSKEDYDEFGPSLFG